METINLNPDHSNAKETFQFMSKFFEKYAESSETFLFRPVAKECERIIIKNQKLTEGDVYRCLLKYRKIWAKETNIEYQVKKAAFPELVK